MKGLTQVKGSIRTQRQSEAQACRLLGLHETVMANMGEGLYAVDTQGGVT
jgi:hypothetical protein